MPIKHLFETEQEYIAALRDYFAAHAITSATMYDTVTPSDLARDAYIIADAMIEERNK